MADGQLKLFKGTQSQLDTINNGTNKKTSDGNLIVAKNDTSSTGNLYIDYDDETRVQLSDDRAYIKGAYANGQLIFTKLNGDSNNVLTVDSTSSLTSTNPIQNKTVSARFEAVEKNHQALQDRTRQAEETISSHDSNLSSLNTWRDETVSPALTSHQTAISTLQGADVGESVRNIAADEIAKQLIADNAQASLDTLQEIAAWIQQHPEDAADMNAAIIGLEEDKAEYQEISRAAYDALSTEEKMNGTIYLIYDENGYISSSVDIVGLQNRVSSLENNMPTTAAHLAYSNASTGMVAANVQAAIDELYTNTQVALGDIERLLAQI